MTKTGEIFFSETIKEAAKESFKRIVPFFKDTKGKKVIEEIEQGNDDMHTIQELKNIFEDKLASDNTFKETLLEITNQYMNEIAEVLKNPTYKFDNYGNVIIGNPVYTTNNHTTINNFIINEDKEFINLINKSSINIREIRDKLKEETIKSKLLKVNYLIEIKDYFQANETCDEIIDLFAQVPEVWDYKAICEYFIDTQKNDTINNSARKIIACLNMAKKLYGHETSESHINISQEISNRYFKTLINRIFRIISNDIKSYKQQIKLFKLISELRTCFEINNNNKFLIAYIDLLSGKEGFTWISLNEDNNHVQKQYILSDSVIFNDNSPTSERIQVLISKVAKRIEQNKNHSYKIPEFVFFYEKFNQTFTVSELIKFLTDKTRELEVRLISLEKSRLNLNHELKDYKSFFILNQLFNSDKGRELRASIHEVQEEIDETKLKIENTRKDLDRFVRIKEYEYSSS
ncbi:MAG TPA: hypothetical protein PKW69_03820 [Niabella sp.]|nr:hypothetical protein [Niabella sp.]